MENIYGVKIKKLNVIPDERGWLMEILRRDDEIFERFGQVYISTVYPGVVKGWHYHKIQTDYITVIKGMVKLALYDSRKNSATHGMIMEFFIGEKNPLLVKIPPLVYHGVKGIGTEPAIMLNCPTEPYNPSSPDEYRVHPYKNDIPYSWEIKEG